MVAFCSGVMSLVVTFCDPSGWTRTRVIWTIPGG
jgi:hypothetical protein